MAKKTKIQNTRKHKRLQAYYLVKYLVKGGGDEPRITNVKDISAGGLKFLAKEFLPEEASLTVNVLIPPLKTPLEAKAKVLRVRKEKKGVTYSVAVRFTEISEHLKSSLNQFIETLAEDKQARLLIDHADVVVRKS